MKRIGIAASKMAKGNLFLYNFYVVAIALLCSFFLFLVSGSSIFIALTLIAFMVNGLLPMEWAQRWSSVVMMCMVTLSMVVGVFNLLAVLVNVKLRLKSRDDYEI